MSKRPRQVSLINSVHERARASVWLPKDVTRVHLLVTNNFGYYVIWAGRENEGGGGKETTPVSDVPDRCVRRAPTSPPTYVRHTSGRKKIFCAVHQKRGDTNACTHICTMILEWLGNHVVSWAGTGSRKISGVEPGFEKLFSKAIMCITFDFFFSSSTRCCSFDGETLSWYFNAAVGSQFCYFGWGSCGLTGSMQVFFVHLSYDIWSG